jgi:hypothetical protein
MAERLASDQGLFKAKPMTASLSTLRVLMFFAFLTLVISLAAHLAAAEVTFLVRGHMIESDGADFQVGDSFVAVYTFDSTTAPTGNRGDDWDAQYIAIRDWRFEFARGYHFHPNDSFAGEVILADNNTSYPGGVDRYIATLFNVTSVGAPLPSGRGVNFLQFDLQDWLPSGDPDLLGDLSLPLAPPSIQLRTVAKGRVVLEGGAQCYFEIDSFNLVPELRVRAMLTTIAAALVAASGRARRHPGRP